MAVSKFFALVAASIMCIFPEHPGFVTPPPKFYSCEDEMKQLLQGSRDRRWFAFRRLDACRPVHAPPVLLSCIMTDEDTMLPFACARLLSEYSGTSGMIKDALRHSNAFVRARLQHAVQSRTALDFKELLVDPSTEVRRLSASKFRRWPHLLLRTARREPDRFVREWMMELHSRGLPKPGRPQPKLTLEQTLAEEQTW